MSSDSRAEAAPRRRPGRPRKDQPDPERFAEILAGAAEVFLARGYDASTIQQVADTVGMLKGSLYHYVRTKEDLLYVILQRTYAAALSEMRRVLEERAGADALELLAAFVETHIRFTIANFAAVSIQFRELRTLSEARRAEITAEGDKYTALLRDLLQRGVEEGTIGADIDLPLASWSILGQLNAMTQWYRNPGRLSIDELVAAFVGMIVSSVVSDRRSAEAGGPASLRASFTPGR
ncbi:TetR/AcrR family transcriptional regulator [Amycolatopsis sp. K13G38]|uniref:TetR/AcrR family transcriptional regulator n=1 Tax=Amycolatopsis acididurans TaxID=2724524 RepID=A0ABX1JC33_9PSEU|nr:TetR/AcrR family transcriptional regulator [Amycolatopsis acididurans]NKQ57233.1 TetR/AcrR family transcriptional regulator [Amycolatopsis acididurans]